MITLKRLGTQQIYRVVLSDSLTGNTDGINQVFYVANEYSTNRIEIIYNGQVLLSPNDFLETGPKEITFVSIKPTNSDVIVANYETGYYSSAEGIGPLSFLGLNDTPKDYSGFENHFVRVNATGNALDFYLPEVDVQEGVVNIPIGVSTTTINFESSFSNISYVLTLGLENTVDLYPSIYPAIIIDKTIDSFTINFSGEIDSSNYYLNWRATLSGIGINSSSNNTDSNLYLSALSDDESPTLSNNLEVGSNLILIDNAPSNVTISGGYVRGYSGEASNMFVSSNSSSGDGWGVPLYMTSGGTWGTCTAISGSTQMPCAAMSLEGGDGDIKKILWKGIIRKGEWNWTPGKVLYVSTVEGAITQVMPNNGHWKQPIGIALKNDTIRFDPGFYPGI